MIAIETIGYGKRTRYVVRAVDERGTIPVDYKIYRTEEAARRAALSSFRRMRSCVSLSGLVR